MSPNSPSSSICCCSRYFRRSSSSQQQQQQNLENIQSTQLEPIEIKVNGQSHLMIPHVAIRPSNTQPAQTAIAEIPVPLATDTLSEINVDIFETARTSRTFSDGKLHPMKDLIRMIRIEEGLDVTPRPDPLPLQVSAVQPSSSTAVQMPTIPEIPEIPEIRRKHSKPRKAVFNEDGDITTRSIASHPRENHLPVYTITNSRKLSAESIGVPVATIPQSHSRAMVRSSPITRQINSAPQIITAFVAFTYACITTIFTSFTNFFSKK